MKCVLFVVALCFIASINAISKVTSGESYKIISAFNHTVLDVKNYRMENQSPVIPYRWKQNDVKNQMWAAEEISPNIFILTTLANKQFVLDSSKTIPGNVIVFKRHGRNNQQWVFEQVRENSFTFYVRNLFDNKVIQLNSDHKSVSMAPKDENNFRQRWVLAESFAPPVAPPKPTQAPPITTEEPPQTTQEPPQTTQEPPQTTQQPPKTTQEPPQTTQEPPQTTQGPPQTTTSEPISDPPGNSTQPPIDEPTQDPSPIHGCDYVVCPPDREIMYFPYIGNCNKYCQCSNYVPIVRPCPPNQVFNPNKNVCDWPHNYECPY